MTARSLDYSQPSGPAGYAPLIGPALMLLVFFVVPFAIMIGISFAHRIDGGFYEPAFEFTNYARFLTAFFGQVLGFSLLLSALVAAVSVGIAFPFTYRLTRMPRRVQVVWLVFVLSILSLSEVLIGFGWSVLLSRTTGLSNVLVWLGLLDQPVALTPSFGAVMTGMVYITTPYAILVLYPALSRFDPQVVEAARMLGASPVKAFFSIVVPAMRQVITSTLIMAFVFSLGCYLLPQLLGRPHQWTLSVLITDQAIYQANMPFAAAMAVFLVVVSLSLVGLAMMIGRRGAVK